MPDSPQSRTAEAAPLPEHVTMPLLTLLTQRSLDEDYEHVARRRAETPGEDRRPRAIAAVVVALFGVLVVTAAVQTSRDADVTEEGRQTLLNRIADQRERVSEQQDTLADLRLANGRLEDSFAAVAARERTATDSLNALKTVTGYGAVTGPGVRIVTNDSPDGDEEGVIRDEDLAQLVDGLWAAGAEAISINGLRLTVLSPIRSANVAINVNNRAVSPPYTILAIGNPDTLQSLLAETTNGSAWFSLVQTWGYEFDMNNVEGSLSLPAAPPKTLRSATEQNNRKPTERELSP